jgi:hypothetical protein
MTQAREQAEQLIWVARDGFGKVAEARTLIPMMEAGSRGERWLRLFGQFFRFDKWSFCQV